MVIKLVVFNLTQDSRLLEHGDNLVTRYYYFHETKKKDCSAVMHSSHLNDDGQLTLIVTVVSPKAISFMIIQRSES